MQESRKSRGGRKAPSFCVFAAAFPFSFGAVSAILITGRRSRRHKKRPVFAAQCGRGEEGAEDLAIVGIGVDCASIERVAKCAAREHFARRVFGERERALFARRREPGPAQAASFAAKEAFGKALGTGILQEFSLCEAEALRNEAGAPYLHFSGRAAQLMAERGLTAHLSLTHEAGLAIAFVVLEKPDAT